MKRWAFVTVGLYAAALSLAMVPLSLGLFGDWWATDGVSLDEVLEVYRWWGFWLWLLIMTGGQAALLLIPLRIAERRLKSRRSVLVPAGAALLLLAVLTFAGVGSIMGALFSDEGVDGFLRAAMFTAAGPEETPTSIPLNVLPATKASEDVQALLGSLNIVLVFWVLWGGLFWRFARKDSTEGMFQRCLNWLLRGSILELLIAVPSHIIVRRRGDCCAPSVTFLGIVTGVAVMMLCFGPGVFYLFMKRFRRLRASSASATPATPVDADSAER